jgi:hypothetical protein
MPLLFHLQSGRNDCDPLSDAELILLSQCHRASAHVSRSLKAWPAFAIALSASHTTCTTDSICVTPAAWLGANCVMA